MLYSPKKEQNPGKSWSHFLMSSMTLSVDKGMGSGRVTHSHSWRAPHTDSLHLQVASKPSPTSARPPLLRTVRPSSLHHSHLTQDPGTRQYSCPPHSVQPHTPYFASLPGILLHPKLFAGPVPGRHSKLSPDITFSGEPSLARQWIRCPSYIPRNSCACLN